MVYNVNLKKARANLLPGAIFSIAGLLFFLLIGGIFISTISKKNSLDSETQAIDVTWVEHNDSDGTTYSPNYKFEVDGKIYICKSTTSSSSKSGKGIVYYDSSNPNNCMTDYESGTNWLLCVFLILPIIFMAIGGGIVRNAIKKSKIAKKLANIGVLVKGIPYQIIDNGMAVNNRRGKCFVVTYKFPDNSVREMKSEPTYGYVLKDHDGRCDLLYDPDNYDNFFIDLEINPTGQGHPRVVVYDQSQQGDNNLSYNSLVNETTYNEINNNYNNDSSYDPTNKF